MFAVVFEVCPAEGKRDEYLDHAKTLKPIIEKIDGFIDNERFESVNRPGWVLSLSTWRDEKAVIRWRVQSDHHGIQALGRAGVFADYRLRVCEITADTAPPMPVREQRFDQTETGEAKALGITEVTPPPIPDPATLAARLALPTAGLTEHDVFASIYNPGKALLLSAWRGLDDAGRWQPASIAGTVRHRVMRTIRHYGMFDRHETPQYFPPVTRG